MTRSFFFIGFEFGMGLILAVLVTVLLFNGISRLIGGGRDDSDPPNGRSDMKVHTDALTGCQYLRGPSGGLTPRLDPNGRQICKRGGE